MSTDVSTGYLLYPKFNFNTKYVIGYDRVKNLKTLLCDESFWTNFSLLFTDYSQYINSIKYYPFNIGDIANFNPDTSSIVVGNKTLPTGQFDGIRGSEIVSIEKSTPLGWIYIPKTYDNFLDYEPFTKIELYVPYFSFINLPVNEVMGKVLYLNLSVDFDTGIGTLYIRVDGRVIMVSTTKLGIDVPIGSSNFNDIMKDNLANGIKLVAGVVTMVAGGVLGAGEKVSGTLLATKGISMAVSSGVDIITNSTVRYSRGSLTGGTDMLASPTSIYAVVTRPNPISINENYNHIKGRPLGDVKVLSTLRGFTTVEDIHLEGFPDALDEELKDIESQLRNGVYL